MYYHDNCWRGRYCHCYGDGSHNLYTHQRRSGCSNYNSANDSHGHHRFYRIQRSNADTDDYNFQYQYEGGGDTVTVTATTTETDVVQTTDDTSTFTSTSTVFVYTGTVTGATTSTIVINTTVDTVVVGTTTITSASVVTTGGPVPATACGNVGLEVAAYTNTFVVAGTGYSAFQPSAFKTMSPAATTTARSVGFVWDAGNAGGPAARSPYGMAGLPQTYALNHRGYFYAPRQATYTFAVQRGDDYAAFWLGAKAFSTWTRGNADGTGIYNDGTNPVSGSKAMSLAAGSYTPIRIVYGNGAGAATLIFSITDNLGNNYVNGTDISPYLVKSPCDPQQGLAFFNPFGQESTSATGSADLSCGLGGVQVAIYPDTVSDNNYPAETLKNQQPNGVTVSNRIGFTEGAVGNNPYGLTAPAVGAYALNYRGFFQPPQDGTYHFRVSQADNWAGVWGTSTALKGWSNSNAQEAVLGTGNSATLDATLVGGQYFPLRVVLASWDGGIHFNFDIFDDAGAYYASTNKPSPYLVWQPCPASDTVPKYKPFGEEI
ncbi:hypothetical protein ABW21_db0203242 [Orbilia brochopaga]|nr:hypothetical protein ABW21_db0203242 [Drechslerella brochopaga]